MKRWDVKQPRTSHFDTVRPEIKSKQDNNHERWVKGGFLVVLANNK